jgi:MEDS: MEthanogen/methylotroph, DcmR Sensory domain
MDTRVAPRPMGLKAVAPHEPSSSRKVHAHLVQLFDAPRSLADAVSHYLIEGRAAGQHLLVIARASHWQLIRAYLERRGFAVEDASHNLTLIDARKIRVRMMRRGVLDPSRMEETLGGLLTELSSAPGELRVYGEIVELFAEEGNFEQACALEDYWNHLQTKSGFTLLCGYSAAHFADPRNSQYLREVCGRHTAVKSQPADSLGTWLTTR